MGFAIPPARAHHLVCGVRRGLTVLLSWQPVRLGSWPVRSCHLISCQPVPPVSISPFISVDSYKKEWENGCVKLGLTLLAQLGWMAEGSERTQNSGTSPSLAGDDSDLKLAHPVWVLVHVVVPEAKICRTWVFLLVVFEFFYFLLSFLAHAYVLLIMIHLPMSKNRTLGSLVWSEQT